MKTKIFSLFLIISISLGFSSCDKNLVGFHEIQALPDLEASTVQVGKSWKRIKTSHPRLQWAPKSFAKVYTVEQIKKQNDSDVAVVKMVASETSEKANDSPEGYDAATMGIFSKMFDPQETFEGKLVLDLGSGKVLDYEEKFVGMYTAIDVPRGKDADKAPDTLMMGFTYIVSLKKVD